MNDDINLTTCSIQSNITINKKKLIRSQVKREIYNLNHLNESLKSVRNLLQIEPLSTHQRKPTSRQRQIAQFAYFPVPVPRAKMCHAGRSEQPTWLDDRASEQNGVGQIWDFFFRKRTNLNRFKDDIDNGNDDDCQDELRGIIALFIYPVAEITSPIPRMVRPKSAQIIDSVESGERRRVEQERQCVETKERKELMKPVYFC